MIPRSLLAVQGAAAISAGDTAWVLVSTALVFVMVVGLALFYGGLVRSKNALNTLMMSVIALGVIGVQWVLFGYSLAFHPGTPWLGGLGWVGFQGVGIEPDPTYSTAIPLQAHAMFQGMFAIITPALISGAIVERMRFRAYIIFLVLWATLVYDPLAHWVWGSGGWLLSLGALDFAGGTVVHLSAGASALVAAWMLGARKDYRRAPLVPHNVPLVLLGAGLLWFGWFGFNAGSALAANGVAGLAFVNTNTAAAAALLTWAMLDLGRTGKVTAVGAATGVVVGLVGITPAAGYVTPVGAIIIGLLCASLSYFAIQIRSRTKLDDSLDVFSCHGVAGCAGALLTGVFATKAANPGGADGLLAGNPAQLGVQAVAVLAALAIAAVGTVVIIALLKATVGVRVGVREEMTGLDLSEHGEEAYFEGGGLAAPGVALGEGVILSTAPASAPKPSDRPPPPATLPKGRAPAV
jgi:ammonium transporter, Amt family